MKKLLLVGAIALLPMTAFADKDVGCGAGTIIFKGQSGLFPKILAATTNGSFGNQTFGITFGTLGCSQDGVIASNVRREMFAGANLDQVAQEMAVGTGESLEALASLYNVSEADRATFRQVAKANYASIFSSSQVTTGDVLAALDVALRADARLAQYV